MNVSIIRADARSLPLADESVDLIVTSPPYFNLRSYRDGGEHYAGQIGDEASPGEYVDSLITATREMVRVCKPEGSIWVNLGDKYAQDSKWGGASGIKNGVGVSAHRGRRLTGFRDKSLMGLPWRYAIRCIDDLGLILRAEVIWDKPNGLPESVTDRVRRSHETWFHFTVRPTYYADLDDIREPHEMRPQRRPNGRPVDATPRPAGQPRQSWPTAQRDTVGVDGHPLGKLPGSVWDVATMPLKAPPELGIDHHAAFPFEIPRRIIRGWSAPGMTVLDPFGGTGTTALVADVLGRNGITVDMSRDYCQLARWRTADPGERARAMQVEKPPAVMDGQLELFDETA